MADALSAEHKEQNKRLDRIEDKLDKLSEAVISLARAEEKISVLMTTSQVQNDSLVRLNNRVDRLEKDVDGNKLTINIINKVFWLIMAAAATIVATNILQ
jgi:tetrahydromethanopterin S-methyltransferase subunit G